LELPLSRHNLGIGTGDLYTSEQASLVVSLDNVSAVDLASANTTVVWALWTRVPTDWPAIGLVEGVKEGVLLLKTEPWLVGLVGLHELSTLMAVVELVRGSIRIPALGNDQDVGSATERVGEDGHRPEVDIRVVAWSLASRAAIEVPLGKVLNLEVTILWDLGESLEISWISTFSSLGPRRLAGVGARVGVSSPLTWNEHHQWRRSRCTFRTISCDSQRKQCYKTYSAIALPFWSRAMYFNSYGRVSTVWRDGDISELGSNSRWQCTRWWWLTSP